MFYQLFYDNYNRARSITKTVMLTFAVLFDFFNIYTFIKICLGDMHSFIDLFVLITAATVLRLIALSLCYQYKVIYKDGLVNIIKILPLKKKIIFSALASDVTAEKCEFDPRSLEKRKNTFIIIDNNELLAYYDIKAINSGDDCKQIILPLDNYMYYLLAEKDKNTAKVKEQ